MLKAENRKRYQAKLKQQEKLAMKKERDGRKIQKNQQKQMEQEQRDSQRHLVRQERERRRQEQDELSQYARERIYETNFSIEMQMKALNIEQEHSRRLYSRYAQDKVKVMRASPGIYYYKSRSYPPQDLERLCLILCTNDGSPDVQGRIESYQEVRSHVYFTVRDQIDLSKEYSIKYESSRLLTNACLKALKSICSYRLENFFKTFDDKRIGMAPKRNIKAPKKWFNKSIAYDPVQKKTVENILMESAYPQPFVITGGPGTGKTSIIVETVAQILDKKSFAHVLITCQSNSACDEVAMRLLSFLPSIKVFRYYAYSYYSTRYSQVEGAQNPNKDSYFEKLSANSTIIPLNGLHAGRYRYVSLDDLMNYKIVIATMSTVHFMVDKYELKGHFDFIFIDECCAATEAESMIPIVSLGMDHQKVLSNIILVGDSKLLGPVVQSPLAKSIGLEQSLLERILRLKLYDLEDAGNNKRVVKLINNYRSHPEIFKYSNETFYNALMEPMISQDGHNFAKEWKLLPNPGIPVVFHSRDSESTVQADSTSVFNEIEVELVFMYVQNLMEHGLASNRKVKEDQIGIASPYLAQVKKLRNRLESIYPRIDIGTTEFFQGREKPIMIISAVKTHNLNENIDFLDNPRRLNVLLTRAKSLLIIVGNLEKLYKFPSWQPFIEHVVKSGSARKGPLRNEPDEDGVLMEPCLMPRIHDDSSEDDDGDEESSDEREE